MANVSGSTNININFVQQKTVGVITPQALPANVALNTSYANGTGANQTDQLYANALTLAATPTTINLQSFTDIAGNAATNAARIRVVVIQNTSAFPLIVGAAGTNPWTGFLNATGTITVPAGGRVVLEDPASTGAAVGAVTGASSLNLKLDPGANTVTCNVILDGVSVA